MKLTKAQRSVLQRASTCLEVGSNRGTGQVLVRHGLLEERYDWKRRGYWYAITPAGRAALEEQP